MNPIFQSLYFRMNAFNKIITATEEFFSIIPVRQISRHINLTTCSGSSVRHVFGNFLLFEHKSNFYLRSRSLIGSKKNC